MDQKPRLILFPVPLADGPLDNVLPKANIDLVSSIKFFIVENIRSARRFLKKCNPAIDIASLSFSVLNRQTDPKEIPPMLEPMDRGYSIGVISEAGCPAVADPGADVVAIAQKRGYDVMPLVGPSSILMGLMGSGFNGQSFAFNGYLPIEKDARTKKFKELERKILRDDQTQIFIETPYRNNRIIADMIDILPPDMKLCVASGITSSAQTITTLPVSQWKRRKFDFDKVPAIFLLYK